MPTPKKPRVVDHIYFVVWNSSGRCWEIERDGIHTPQFAYDKTTAIRMAIRTASWETATGQKAVVKSVHEGVVRVEWSSP